MRASTGLEVLYMLAYIKGTKGGKDWRTSSFSRSLISMEQALEVDLRLLPIPSFTSVAQCKLFTHEYSGLGGERITPRLIAESTLSRF